MIKDTITAVAGAAGTYTAGTALQDILVNGQDPMTATLLALAGVIPNPWLLLFGYLYWKFVGKNQLATWRKKKAEHEERHARIDEKREKLLELLEASQESMNLYIAEPRLWNQQYQETHMRTILRLEEKINDIHTHVHKEE